MEQSIGVWNKRLRLQWRSKGGGAKTRAPVSVKNPEPIRGYHQPVLDGVPPPLGKDGVPPSGRMAYPLWARMGYPLSARMGYLPLGPGSGYPPLRLGPSRGTHPVDRYADRQTRVKLLPSLVLRTRALIIRLCLLLRASNRCLRNSGSVTGVSHSSGSSITVVTSEII